jgi:hypothetical protein
MASSTPRRAVELEIERWKVEETGFTNAPYLARFELVWPRPGIENVKRVIPLPDQFGTEVDWSNDDLLKKWLFKEDMEGRMILTASVIPVQADQSDPAIPDDALDLIGRSVARESSIAWRTLSDLIELGGNVAKYLLAGPQKSIARGHVVIDEQTNKTLSIPLEAPNQLRNPEPDPTPEDHRPEDDHQEILKDTGESNGFMDVKMSVWDE